MRKGWFHGLGFTLLAATGLSLVALALLASQPVPPWGNPMGAELSGDIGGTAQVGESFRARLPGLSGIEVMLDRAASSGGQAIVFHLKRAPDSPVDLVTRAVGTADVNGPTRKRIDFDRILESEGQSYYFYLDSPDSVESSIAVRYSPDADLEGGRAYENGRPLSGNLQFRSFYSPTALQRADILLKRLAEGRPSLLGTKGFYAVLALAYLGMLGLFAVQMVRELRQQDG
jgi:hypothetical protein